MTTVRNYILPEKIDGNYVLEGENSVTIVGPAINFYGKVPAVTQYVFEVFDIEDLIDLETLEPYATGAFGLDSSANMEALLNRVIDLTARVVQLETILKNIGLCTS
jgi:hypothetical protein